MNVIKVNGRVYTTNEKDISVVTVGNKTTVKVGGKIVDTTDDVNITITFEGDLASLDATIATVNGNIHGDVDCTNLVCGDIGGDVDATNVKAKTINGKVDAVNVTK